ncbi:WG repeat-containing protein [Sinanaerobacter sp. ZZT-01]|uniref:WG repeat-containing protein n=1 Tax=Sinanaerobacter sp. ZZT-01 TaxID=3111540 RepID=UPI002D76516B|nr:WG repeat-containing protein [Sinanaerobacter sp. ZZT-01]WRR93625.1 WG repeat-containing protein [Sinanaerobacter sp. ZZT-01]
MGIAELSESESALTKSKKGIMIAIVAIAILLIGIKAYEFYQQKQLLEKTISNLNWEIPLEKDFEFIDWRQMKLNKEFEKYGLKVFSVVVEDKEEYGIFDKLFGVMRKDGEIIIPAIYETLTPDWDMKYILGKNWSTDQAHYYSLDGGNYIAKTFKSASPFENGYAVVEDEAGYYIIEPSGEIKLKFDCDFLSIFDSERGLYQFQAQSNKNSIGGRWGLVDINGTILLDPKYDVIEKADEDKLLVIYKTESVFQESKYLDYDFKPLFEESFEHAEPFSDGLAPAKRENDTWGLMNTNGEIVQRISCSDFYSYSEELSIVGRGKRLCGIDKNGDAVFEVPYEESNSITGLRRGFQDGLLLFRGKNGKYGYIDRNGDVVIPPVFDDADPFEDGKTFVEVNGQGGVITRDGI